MIEDFEHQIKRNFSKQAREDDLWSVDLRGVEDDPEKGIEDDTIQIRTNSLTAVFDVVCLKIQGLVERQIIQMEESRVLPKVCPSCSNCNNQNRSNGRVFNRPYYWLAGLERASIYMIISE